MTYIDRLNAKTAKHYHLPSLSFPVWANDQSRPEAAAQSSRDMQQTRN